MPIYVYDCQGCGEEITMYSSIDLRDAEYCHRDHEPSVECIGALLRRKVQPVTLGKPSFQSGAVMSDGSIVKGHFGKTARKDKGWHRP